MRAPKELVAQAWIGTLVAVTLGCQGADFAGGGPEFAASGAVDDGTPAEPLSTCSPQQIGSAVRVVAAIDNSTSTRTTDRCAWSDYTSSCRQRPQRIEAMENLHHNVLGPHAEALRAQGKRPSEVAIYGFPARDRHGVLPATRGWQAADVLGTVSFDRLMQFAYRPDGYTPYGQALAEALRLFDEGESTERQALVLGTDGFPTDADAGRVLALADALRERGVLIYTVIVLNNRTWAEERRRHQRRLQSYRFSAEQQRAILGTENQQPLVERVSDHVASVASYDDFEAALREVVGRVVTHECAD